MRFTGFLALLGMATATAADSQPYPEASALIVSTGGVTYHIDPAKGDDTRDGRTPAAAWKTFTRLNGLRLSAGDKVLVAPGLHPYSLKPAVDATADKPAVIRFLPGTHEFAAEGAVRRPWFISNSCDAPTVPKTIGILVENSKNLRFEGAGGDKPSLILMGGRMIEFINSHSENITYTGLSFDLKRPTVSEFRVEDSAPGYSIVRIAEGSTHSFQDGKFAWTGDLGSGAVMAQQAIPAEGRCWRLGLNWDPFSFAQSVTRLDEGKFRLDFKDGYRLQTGHQFQFRHIFRDSAGGVNDRSKNITFRDCNFHALTNMGIISQFTENLSFQRVNIAPPANTLRTCPCWADALHFSGCRGNILVDGCRFYGLQDDPINVHGTHLRIIAKTSENQFHIQFKQPQTYGFAAFAPGDEIAVISHNSLTELPGNPHRKVSAIEPKPGDTSGKDWLLTLDGPVPNFGQDDVIDNLTWYPNLIARNNHVEMASCRGFLVTTRGKALIENNTFHRCAMPGLLVEDDANGWFESGPIRDLTIKGNRFIGCGIHINPQTKTPDQPVHENIRILDNFFDGSGIDANGSRGLTITGNRFTKDVSIHTGKCQDVVAKDNSPGASR